MRKGESLQDRQQEMKEKWNNTPRKRRKKFQGLTIEQSTKLIENLSEKLRNNNLFERNTAIFKKTKI